MRRIRWVPEPAVRAMHAELIAEHGGRKGVRDAAGDWDEKKLSRWLKKNSVYIGAIRYTVPVP